MLFNFAARPQLGWKTLWILVTTILLTMNGIYDYVTFLKLNDGLDKDILGLLAIGMTYLIGVRVSLSYDRYYEARKKWGMMVNRTRDLVRQFHGYCDDAALRADATKWTAAFVYACKQHLRWKTRCPSLRRTGLLSAVELAALEASDHMPNYCMERLTACIAASRASGAIDGFSFRAMDENIQSFEDQIGACERILKTPVPFAFVLHLRSIIMLNIIALPLYLMNTIFWGAIPITLLYAYCLTGLEDLGQAVENPFRENFHALPLDGICECIRKNLIEIQQRSLTRA